MQLTFHHSLLLVDICQNTSHVCATSKGRKWPEMRWSAAEDQTDVEMLSRGQMQEEHCGVCAGVMRLYGSQ